MVAFALLVGKICLLCMLHLTVEHAMDSLKMNFRDSCSTDLMSTLQIAVETFKAGPGLVP